MYCIMIANVRSNMRTRSVRDGGYLHELDGKEKLKYAYVMLVSFDQCLKAYMQPSCLDRKCTEVHRNRTAVLLCTENGLIVKILM